MKKTYIIKYSGGRVIHFYFIKNEIHDGAELYCDKEGNTGIDGSKVMYENNLTVTIYYTVCNQDTFENLLALKKHRICCHTKEIETCLGDKCQDETYRELFHRYYNA